MSEPELKLGRSFVWLNVTQFLGALNDNLFKLLIIMYLIGPDKSRAGVVNATAGAVFVAPFLIFTAFAGRLADRFSKRDIIVAVKWVEVAVMSAGCLAFLEGSEWMLYAILFLMCAQSAFFGPSKYGIVPEIVRPEQLSRANSVLEAMTYLAIIFGTAAAPFLASVMKDRYFLAGAICIFIAIAGVTASYGIGKISATKDSAAGGIAFVRDILRTLAGIRKDAWLFAAVLAGAYFMLLGAIVQMNLLTYGIQSLGLDEKQSGYLFVIAAVGIGAGAYLAGRLSGRTIEIGLVPVGASGMAACSLAMGLTAGGRYLTGGLIIILGLSAGLFIVPINAFIQLKSPAARRGRILAASGFLGWLGVLAAAILMFVFDKYSGLSAKGVFVFLGVMTLLLAVAAIVVLPYHLVRLVLVIITRLIYRVKVFNADNVPAQGGALLISNHVSWVDSLLIGSSLQRHVRFIMERRMYEWKPVNRLCRLMKVIPIDPGKGPKQLLETFRLARQAIEAGDLVCIFAEGAITRTGMPGRFRAGFERIVKQTGCAIVPVYLGGLWGSVFSHYYGRIFSTLPKKLPFPVSVHFGKAMSCQSNAEQVQSAVTELSCEYFESLKPGRKSLGENFVHIARKNRRRRCISDSTGRKLNYGRTLAAATALSDRLAKMLPDEKMVGVLLPPSVGGALVNLAITISGRIAVNLNYTCTKRQVQDAIDESTIRTVISSRRFIEKIGSFGELSGIVFLEDIAEAISKQNRLTAYIKSIFLPARFLAHSKNFQADAPAVVLFSSGSSGRSKGIVLSHHNIISNVEGMRSVVRIFPEDSLCAVLPFFHSFGLTCGLWLPLLCGVSASYIPNPLDAKSVGQTAGSNESTILFAAPAFLSNYIRRIDRRDFSHLRLVVVGAEKLRENLAVEFEEKFGIRPREGYGATELSPVISVNVPDAEVGGFKQIGDKPGTVGHPLPGIAVRVVDIMTKKPVGAGQAGILQVKGPNVMIGYLNNPEKTAEVVKQGWYDTGDIVTIDEDGFIRITDRLSRFSKIAGEMIPHIAIEEVCMCGIEPGKQLVAVTSVPDGKKGEEIVVLYLDQAGDADKLYEKVSDSGLPNIYKPRRDNYIRVENLPLLGSGKLDIMELKRMAARARPVPKVIE